MNSFAIETYPPCSDGSDEDWVVREVLLFIVEAEDRATAISKFDERYWDLFPGVNGSLLQVWDDGPLSSSAD